MNTTRSLLCSAMLLCVGCDAYDAVETIDEYGPMVEFAKEAIRDSLGPGSDAVVFRLDTGAADVEREGFVVRRRGDRVEISARDTAGLMYGGLEVAEQVRLYGLGSVDASVQNPYMAMRGTKFNIPLDVRTPSYSHASDGAQRNMPHMWDFQFWKEYIDTLARHRYNFISLWSLHPFPSLVKVPDYPEIALDDVHRSTTEWSEYYSLGARDQDAPEIVNNFEVLKDVSIEEKIAFWREVMAYGKSRNVDFYFVTWNIFTNGTMGQYDITNEAGNEVTRDYFRKSIVELFRTYPDLAGIGITTGENMKGMTFEEKEDWAWDTYGRAVLQVAQEMPEREFRFIHRQHQADPDYIEKKFAPLIERNNVDFIYSFKYAKAHVFSATEQPYHHEFVANLVEQRKTIWTLRNDDAYYFQWGAPEFVREFVRNIPYDVSQGMYYGSDQWIWGRDFLSRDSSVAGQLDIERHWYHWLMWGRLSYDPDIATERFVQLLADRFPDVDANSLYLAWHEASLVYPVTTGFHWGRVDFLWYIEGCRSRPENAGNETGFHDVDAFINYPVHPKAGNQTIPDFVTMTLAGDSSDLNSPFQVAGQLHATADSALLRLESLDAGSDAGVERVLQDVRSIALMGKYYAHKIAGSTNVALYRATGDSDYQNEAIRELSTALDYWKRYVSTASQQYHNPVWLNRVGIVDWVQSTEWVAADIETAREVVH